MDYSKQKSSLMAKMCSIHKENELEYVCLNPFCSARKVLCVKCLNEDKFHSGNHHETIFRIDSFLDKVKELICSDFYENKLKSLSINDYKKTFQTLMDNNLQKALEELEQFEEKVRYLIKNQRDYLEKMCIEQKEIFSMVIDSYRETLKQGEKYEANLCNMQDRYNELMSLYAHTEKLDNNEVYEKQIIAFAYKLFCTINYKNTFQEERTKSDVKKLLTKIESAIQNPPEIIINPKLYDTYKIIESRIYCQNLIDETIQLSVKSLDSMLVDNIKIYPNYFYGINKFCCLYTQEDNKILCVKLSENQSHAQINTYEIKNYDFVMKGISCCSTTVLPEGRIFLTGGYSSFTNGTTNSLFEFNIETCKAIKLQPMINGRYHHGTCYLDNKIYVIGGRSIGGKDESINLSEYYDLNTKKWFPIFPTKVACHHSAVCSFGSRFLYKFGGYNNLQPVNTIERYSIPKNRWEILEVEGLKTLNFIAQAEALKINKDTIMIFGGAANLRNHPYMGITLFFKTINYDENISEDELKYEITMNSKYQIGSPTFFTCPKRCVIHDFCLYALTNSHHLLKFDGISWQELV